MISDKTDLSQDLDIAAAMATGMKDYLTGSNLFQPLSQPGMPSLTLGGYLMRAHRLDALRSQLDPADQRRLDETQATFHQALVERGPQFQQKANQELKARLRQWNEFLKDFDRRSGMYREPWMNPTTLTTGSTTNVPATRSGWRRANRRRAISVPFNSSPCTAAVTNNRGPGRLP
jgi:hypothetical protein